MDVKFKRMRMVPVSTKENVTSNSECGEGANKDTSEENEEDLGADVIDMLGVEAFGIEGDTFK